MRWWQRITAEQHPSLFDHRQQQQQQQSQMQPDGFGRDATSLRSVSAAAKAFLLNKRRLRLDPDKKLVFEYEPGKQVSSAVKIKNVSRSNVAFKFQTTAPKSCFMRPPNGIIKPNETIYATVVKFVEQPERPQQKRAKEKFKIVSLKVKDGVEYTPELFEEQRELVTVERILQVVFVDPQHTSPAELERLRKRLAEAEAAQEARKKPCEEKNPKGAVVEGLVIDEWKERREKYLARQQVEGADSY
ncbi:vesicle-associated protein 4-2 [Selaginella moellendorffii]|nr:vesicle-associated protein 4-2 isoform X2 [Selaginella moellendorffii]XP_024544113.1 vesicle-associated protein 4-2 [Selaginella moellendorffii]|eukprot:XP_002960685.2 vesicle-associated protein 4-2 isoform X2 [Selaginella moellendorffii]